MLLLIKALFAVDKPSGYWRRGRGISAQSPFKDYDDVGGVVGMDFA